MKQGLTVVLALWCSVTAWGWEAFEVSPSIYTQRAPAVSGDIIVWQEYVEIDGQWDWDIYGVDLINDPEGFITIAALEADQTRPSIWGTRVVWEDNYYGDIDIWVSDITNPASVQMYPITPYEDDQDRPRIHGNTVVWQHLYVDSATQQSDWDIYAADITDLENPLVYDVAAMEADQQFPALYRNRIVWQDNYYGEHDILSADVWQRNAPALYPVAALQTNQENPATEGTYVIWQEDDGNGTTLIFGADVANPDNPVEFLISSTPGPKRGLALSGNLVVWQDNRYTAWNIYGYNHVTRQEFPITDDAYNQTSPAIDGRLVVFEDDRYGAPVIFAVRLNGPEVADCPTPLQGDTNGDCRVDLEDLAAVALNWLTEALVY